MLKASLAAGFTLIVTASAAYAARPENCANYAAATIEQIRGARSIPNCAGGAVGPRWSPDYNYHYQWCLGAPQNVVQAERFQRTNYLRSCRR